MNSCQDFPETVEEFMEEYKMVDTEEVYSNGTEFVPIFRMNQWFEHERAKRGKWIQMTEYDIDENAVFLCSLCNGSDVHAKGVSVPYCWHCGARMEKEG